jgi:hypothetical protein
VAEVPLDDELQDRVYRDKGGGWLDAQTRNSPTHPDEVQKAVEPLPDYSFAGGSYGAHLKAVVEAFVFAARQKLLGPAYRMGRRLVPRMAFRIEITDEFRLEGLAGLLYSDLIRYGLFMRDSRGKSVRGAMVPRLYLRRLLLPYCTLALSKRDSVSMSCEQFVGMLMFPDRFKSSFPRTRPRMRASDPDQLSLFGPLGEGEVPDPAYDDLEEDEDE